MLRGSLTDLSIDVALGVEAVLQDDERFTQATRREGLGAMIAQAVRLAFNTRR
jgi:hypothetical protein